MTIKAENVRYMMEMKRISLLLLLSAFSIIGVRAQYDPSFSHYWAMEPSFNPATVGKEMKVNVAAAYNMTLTGFEHNPRTMYAGADIPFYFIRNYHGAGVQFVNDQIGLFSHKKFALQYAFRHRLFGGMLAAGVHLGMISESFDGGGVDLETPDDPAFPTSEATGSGVDIGLGLYYRHHRWYAGLSVQHLNGPDIEIGERQNFKIDPAYYLTAGYNIPLRNPFLSIHPSVLARTDAVAYRVDVGGRVEYRHEKKLMYGGVSYSPTNSVTVLVGGDFHGVRLGYSYEIYTSAVSIGNGSHELFIGYQTDMDLKKKGKNKHKSVRLL